MLAIFRLGKEHQEFRADQRRQQEPQTEIVNSFARQSIAPGQLYRHKNRAQKSQGQKHSVGINRETKDAKKNGIHEKVIGQWSVLSGQWSVVSGRAVVSLN